MNNISQFFWFCSGAHIDTLKKYPTEHNKYVGICGQGPSDHIDFAKWLMEQGIEAMSLTPDSIIKTWLALAKCTN